MGQHGKGKHRKHASIESATQTGGVGLVMHLAGTTMPKVRKGLSDSKLAALPAGQQRSDRVRTVPTEPPSRIKRGELLALALASPRGVAGLVLRELKRSGDSAPRASVGDEREHASLKRCQLGEELTDDQIVLASEQYLLGLFPRSSQLALSDHPRRGLVEHVCPHTVITMQAQCTQPYPPAQSAMQMLLAIKVLCLFEEPGGGHVIQVLDLVKACARALIELTGISKLAAAPASK